MHTLRIALAVSALLGCSAPSGAPVHEAPATTAPIVSTARLPYHDLLYRFPNSLDATEVDRPARSIGGPVPKYPVDLVAQQVEGFVRLRFVVKADGTVDSASVEVVSATHEAFEDAAVAAMREWRFLPAERGNMPVAQRVEQTVRFGLGEKSP